MSEVVVSGPTWLGHPALPLVVAALVLLVVPRRIGSGVVVVGPLVALALLVAGRGGVSEGLELYGLVLVPLRLDALAVVFSVAFALAVLVANVFGLATSGRTERVAGLLTAAAAIGVVVAGDLVTLFFWWEVKAVASTVVVAAAGSSSSAAAALRYVFIHVGGGAFLLAGIAWHLAETGTSTFGALAITPATTLIAIGFLVAAAAVPLHGWLPDAYPSATITGTVLLSAFTTKAAVYTLARGFAGTEALLWVGVVMALYGVVFAMVQDDLRRLLSYHIVSQVGFMVAAVGVGTAAAINGATAHAAAHIVYKGLLLMGVGAVIHATARRSASELGGLARSLPLVLTAYVIGALSISGVPLLSGFVSKELSIQAIGDAGHAAAVIALKIASVGTLLSTLGKLPYSTFVARPAAAVAILRRPTASMYVAMAIATGLCIGVGIAPQLLWTQLPFEVAYTPYSTGKVVETLQLLGVAAVGFWVLRRQLAPHPGVVLDVDRLVERAPMLVGRLLSGLPSINRRTPGPIGSAAAVLMRRDAVWSTQPAWWVGAVIVTAGIVVMVGSVWR